MLSVSVRKLNDGSKLKEKSTATLLKKTAQINETNNKLEPVKVKSYFSGQKFSTEYNFLFVLFYLVFFSNVAVLFPLNFNVSCRVVTILDLAKEGLNPVEPNDYICSPKLKFIPRVSNCSDE